MPLVFTDRKCKDIPLRFSRFGSAGKNLKVAIFRHTAPEPAGYFENVVVQNGIPFEYIRLYAACRIFCERSSWTS
jgi:hypothetical protein